MPKYSTLVLFLCLGSSVSHAAGKMFPTLRKGNAELGAFLGTGYGYGLNESAYTKQGLSAPTVTGATKHLFGGGDFGFAVTRSVFVVGEISYVPNLSSLTYCGGVCALEQANSSNTTGGRAAGTIYTVLRKLTEYNGGLHHLVKQMWPECPPA